MYLCSSRSTSFTRYLIALALTSLVKFIIFGKSKSREMWDRANLGSSATSTLFRSSSASKFDVGGGGVQDDEEVKNKFELGGLFPILLAGELMEVTIFCVCYVTFHNKRRGPVHDTKQRKTPDVKNLLMGRSLPDVMCWPLDIGS